MNSRTEKRLHQSLRKQLEELEATYDHETYCREKAKRILSDPYIDKELQELREQHGIEFCEENPHIAPMLKAIGNRDEDKLVAIFMERKPLVEVVREQYENMKEDRKRRKEERRRKGGQ